MTDKISDMLRHMAFPLANHLWQSTVFALVAAGVILLPRKNAARYRFNIWFLASAKFLVPFELLIPFRVASRPARFCRVVNGLHFHCGGSESTIPPVHSEVIFAAYIVESDLRQSAGPNRNCLDHNYSLPAASGWPSSPSFRTACTLPPRLAWVRAKACL